MSESFSGAKVLCPTCKAHTFVQDKPWKLQCVTCYLARKGKTAPTADYSVTKPRPVEPGMLRRLIQLCHPDKHHGSEAANIATRYAQFPVIGSCRSKLSACHW